MEAYKSAELVGRRSSTYARKLQRLGLWRAESGPILDIACGTGEALCLLNSAGHQHLVGLDPTTHRNPCEPFHRVSGEGSHLPFPDGHFRHVICLHSLHHFRDLDQVVEMLAEARRVMHPTGRLYLIDHFGSFYLHWIFKVLELRLPVFPKVMKDFGVQLRHEREYIYWWLKNWRELFPALEQTGLRVVRCRRRLFFFYLVAEPM
ncbi:MAG: class I SAM-dependent methyltransferase [Candidatus Latescibacterota bacterium]|nr:class I SAM-dependent methyltransferase [Candidatus Latescibacterota bacterium]